MQPRSLLTLGLAATGVVSLALPSRHSAAITTRATLNLPAIRDAIIVFSDNLQAIDADLKALTKSNAAEKAADVAATLSAMSADMTEQAKQLNASGPIQATGLLSFMSASSRDEWKNVSRNLVSALDSTLHDIRDKRAVLHETGQAETIAAALRAQKNAALAVWSTVSGQIPPEVIAQLEPLVKNVKLPGTLALLGLTSGAQLLPTNFNGPQVMALVGMALDYFYDQTEAYLKEDPTAFALLPSGLFGFSGTAGDGDDYSTLEALSSLLGGSEGHGGLKPPSFR